MSHPPHLIVIALAAVASAAPPAPRFRFSFDDGSASASDDSSPLFSGVVQNYATTAGPDGTTAILLLNMHTSAFTAEADFAKDLGLHQSMRQRDIWAGKDGATGTSARLEVASYDSAFWLLTPA